MHKLRQAIAALVLALSFLVGGTPASAGVFLAASSSHVGAIAANKRRNTVPPPPPPAITYDTGMGNGVDSLGIADLPLRAGAHRYFVNSSTGTDTNNCTAAQTSTTPKATLGGGFSCVTAGVGDQILLAEGTTYTEDWGNGTAVYPAFNGGTWIAFKGGFSALYPTVVQSYDPADPNNANKYGRAYERNSWPTFTGVQTQDSNGTWANFAMRGIKFDHGGVATFSTFQGTVSNLLIEANYFKDTQLQVLTNSASGANGPQLLATNLIIRNNVFDTPWDQNVICCGGNGRIGALLVEGRNGFTWEDNFVYHNGWGPSQTRAQVVTAQDETHPIYESPSNTGFIGRRNLVIDPSADGGGARGDGLFTENVLIGSPGGFGLGPPSTEINQRREGEDLRASYNLIMAGIDFNPGVAPRSGGVSSNLGKPGSSIDHNLMIHGNPHGTAYSNLAWGSSSYLSYIEIHHNISTDWTDSGSTYYTVGGVTPSYALPFTSYDYNIWDDPTSGTNTNDDGVSFPHTYTEAQLYVAAGYADKAALVAAMLANPTLHVQRTLRSLAFAGYGMPLDDSQRADQTAPVLSSPTASSPSAGHATISATTNEGNGKLYAELLPVPDATTPPTLNAPTTSTTGGGMSWDVLHYYKVTALTAAGETLTSNEVSAQTASGFSGTVTLTWSAVTGATGYRIYRGVFPGNQTLRATVGNTTTFTDTDTGTTMLPASPSNQLNPAQVKMGVDAANAAAAGRGSATVSATGVNSVSLSSLPAGTYLAKIIQEDAAGNKSSIATTSSFTLAPESAIWDASTDTPPSHANWVRSGGNLTITRTTNTGFWAVAHASTSRGSGTVIFTIGAMGGGTFQYVGFDDGTETVNLGGSGSHSIGWQSNGSILVNGGIGATAVTWTTGNALKIVKAGNIYSFYRDNVFAASYDATGKTFLVGSVFPAAANGNSTGMAVTADFSGW